MDLNGDTVVYYHNGRRTNWSCMFFPTWYERLFGATIQQFQQYKNEERRSRRVNASFSTAVTCQVHTYTIDEIKFSQVDAPALRLSVLLKEMRIQHRLG